MTHLLFSHHPNNHPTTSPNHYAGVSFSFTPLKASSGASPSFLTPSKVLLANGETRMNMLSPGLDATKLFHADVEYGKVVSEWRFNKDEVDIPQVQYTYCVYVVWCVVLCCV
jgi:hypothetical protein